MENEIKLSIVVPVYNVEDYLVECIESIIGAYVDGVEVILIDDGSTDRSSIICDSYEEKYNYIRVNHKKNGGLSSARNTGINIAKGKYIWFIDSDDYINSNSIELVIKAIEEDKDMIFINYQRVYPDKRVYFYQGFKESDNLNIEPYKYLRNLGNISYAAQKFIVKRSLILENEIFFTEGLYHEDEDWTPRIVCSAESFTRIMPAIYNYRVGNPNSITGMLNPKKVHDKIIVSENIYNRIKNNEYTSTMKEYLKERIAHNYIAALNETAMYSDKEKKELVKELKEKKYLLDGVKSKKATLVRNCLNIIGVKNTAFILNIRTKLIKDN